eukprot:CAMPEP_0171185914 /NCGR_PEP_ID=MMETSP0790-20130122/16543_1 /TAXON_ID=2925 /ORGANISM="Alexandrium catenella, Strain OF101" /LENGTH=179 /DNA_ID=CAMNT_0011650943 /DNA_START=12 /DNA_END=551 /DNA_ORIENTATION=-
MAAKSADDPRMVSLNVYDLTRWKFVEALNHMAVPMGVGGLFHVAIEVWDEEWSYGGSMKGTGITSVLPGKDPSHNFRASIPLGRTELSKRQVQEIILELAGEWPGVHYDCIRRNCCTFAQVLAERLRAGPLPGWVDRLCRTAAGALAPVDSAIALAGAAGTLERCCGTAMVILPAAKDN